MRLLARLLTVLLLSSLSFGQSPIPKLLEALGKNRIKEELQPAVRAGLGVPAARGVSGLTLHAYLRHVGQNNGSEVFHARSIEFQDFWLQPGGRYVFKFSGALGPATVKVFAVHVAGSKHLEGAVFFLNDEDTNPVGAIKTDWVGVGVDDGLGQFIARSPVPLGIEPYYLPQDRDVSTWKLKNVDELYTGNLYALPFLYSWGDYAYTEDVLLNPRHLDRIGEFSVPSQPLTSQDAKALTTKAKADWLAFQTDDRGDRDPSYLFGDPKDIGDSGDQGHIGHFPVTAVTNPRVSSEYAADHFRSLCMFVEGRRKYFLRWPLERNKAYNFKGIHFTSKWNSGYVRGPAGWVPAWGDDHGITGYNLEHLRSRLPELAFYTQDPALMWMTSRLARVIMCTATWSGIGDGGYYGGEFTTARGWTRPFAEGLECYLALKSFGDIYEEEVRALSEWLDHKTTVLASTHPRFAKNPDRPDEHIPDHYGEPISELWQMGIGGPYYWTYHLLTGNPEPLKLVRNMQTMHVQGWIGEAMFKQVLAADWSIGRKPHVSHDGLVRWNRCLISVPGVPGTNQAVLTNRLATIDNRFPKTYASKWGSGAWANWKPMETKAK